ncbi:hypothetical protein ACTFIV_008496 [Dictyostelium citrinum]
MYLINSKAQFPAPNVDHLNGRYEFNDDILKKEKKYQNLIHPFQFGQYDSPEISKHILFEIISEKLVEIHLLKKEISKFIQLENLNPPNNTPDQLFKMTINCNGNPIQQYVSGNDNKIFEELIKNQMKLNEKENEYFIRYLYETDELLENKEKKKLVIVEDPPNLILIKNQTFFNNLLQSLKMKLSFENIIEKPINDIEGVKKNDILFFASTSSGTITNIEKDTLQINEIRSKIGNNIKILYCIFNMGKEAKPIIKIENTTSFSLTHSNNHHKQRSTVSFGNKKKMNFESIEFITCPPKPMPKPNKPSKPLKTSLIA